MTQDCLQCGKALANTEMEIVKINSGKGDVDFMPVGGIHTKCKDKWVEENVA